MFATQPTQPPSPKMNEKDVKVVIFKSPRSGTDASESTKVMTVEQMEKYKSYAPRDELKRINKARKIF